MFKRFLPPARVRNTHQSEAELTLLFKKPRGSRALLQYWHQQTSVPWERGPSGPPNTPLFSLLLPCSALTGRSNFYPAASEGRVRRAAGVQVDFSHREGAGTGPWHRRSMAGGVGSAACVWREKKKSNPSLITSTLLLKKNIKRNGYL